jgi:hypothetical protein
MSKKAPAPGSQGLDPEDIESYVALARIHAETADTSQRIGDLEDLARVAWRIMTPEQRTLFLAEPEVLAIADSFGDFADGQNADF